MRFSHQQDTPLFLKKENPMSVEFFNFGNNETFHFFKWICESEPGPDALIAEAERKAETVEHDEFEWEDICFIVRNRLMTKFGEILFDIAPELDNDLLEIGKIETPLWSHTADGHADSLLQPIFAVALSRIDFQAVAEALLIQAGKWNPSKVGPEAI
jgi:hypothetical protein